MTTRTYKVKKKDIKNGKRGYCKKCPVALAIQRQMPFDWEVSVGSFMGASIIFYNREDAGKGLNARRIGLQTPTTVSQFISAFDEGLPVEPFEFELPDLGKIL